MLDLTMPFAKEHVPWNKGKKRPDMFSNQFAKGNQPNKTSFVKGHIPWNKGKKRTQSESENGMWKGNDAGVTAIHLWLKRKFGKAKVCESCGSRKNVQWANIDHKYYRTIKEWSQLCASCHKKQDYSSGLMGNAGFQKENYYGKSKF